MKLKPAHKVAFISQPMKGKTAEKIRKERQDLVENLMEMGYEIANSIFEDFPAANEEYRSVPLAYLAKSLDLLAKCDGVAFAPGWAEARGCKIEHDCAVAYGIPVLIE